MKNKQILVAVLFTVWYAFIFGLAVPSLISAKDDIAPLAGSALALFHVLGPIFWFNREKKQDVV